MLNATHPLMATPTGPMAERVAEAKELKQAFGQFVGETMFGSMLKSMRATVGEPAYFHGGSAERHFQARLDQQMAADLAEGQGAELAQSMFEQQFPDRAQLLREHAESLAAAKPLSPGALDSLDALRRY